MQRAVLIVFCAILSASTKAEDVDLLSSLKICKSDASDWGECLKVAIQDAIPLFANGIPDLGIPGIDPYVVTKQEGEYTNGVLRGKVVTKNTKTYGMLRTKVLSVEPHRQEDKLRLECDVEIPNIFVEGEYKMEASLNELKLGGKGFFNVSIEGIRTMWDVNGHVVDDRFVVDHFRMFPEVNKMKIWFSDLFNGDETLNKLTLDLVNSAWPMIYRQMLPVFSQSVDREMTQAANVIFSKLPYSKIFP